MSIKDKLLAKGFKNEPASQAKKPVSKRSSSLSAESSLPPMPANVDGFYFSNASYPVPDPTIFIAVHAPLLRSPLYYMTNYTAFRSYKNWLLGDSLYVLNTFKPIDTEEIFRLYKQAGFCDFVQQCSYLIQWLHYLGMFVPNTYQEAFEDIIRQNFSIDKNRENR